MVGTTVGMLVVTGVAVLVGRAVGTGVLVRVRVGSGVLVGGAVGIGVLVAAAVGVLIGVAVPVGSAETLKLHTLCVPTAEINAQEFKLVTLACSVRKAKFVPTVCSAPPVGVTNTS